MKEQPQKSESEFGHTANCYLGFNRGYEKLLRSKFNHGQHEILKAWPELTVAFLRQEWRSAGLGYCTGALLGVFGTLVTAYAASRTLWGLSGTILAGYWKLLNTYAPNFWFVLVPLALIALLNLASIAGRAARSWLLGVTSGAYFWPFVITLACFWNVPTLSVKRGLLALGTTCLALLLGFIFRISAAIAREKTVDMNAIRVDRPESGFYGARDAASPIESWDEDRLDRSPFIEMLAARVLVSKAPVIALRGGFGDGKTSVLNLLRLRIGRSAIVVSFSSWLPDSQQTLVDDLFGDIATEIGKNVIIPGLRKRLLKFASLLGGTLPYLKALPEILPPYTQRHEIRDLGQVLGRIPKRVVVLLDEIDRMQRDELLTLLKVIRGAYSVVNLTFVCALTQEEIERLACGKYDASSHEFFEKFFPTAIDLPKPSPDVLRQMLSDQVMASFEGVAWFNDESERIAFAERLNQLWGKALVFTCTNVRKIGLVANGVHAAAALVKGEVDPIDLCALDTLRRFHPKVYDLVWTNAGFFSDSGHWWKLGVYLPDAEVGAQIQNIANTIKSILREDSSEREVYALLEEMFPERLKELSTGRRRQPTGAYLAKAEQGKRISHPDYFPLYFRWAVPDSLFSSVEMSRFEAGLQSATSDAGRRSMFEDKLDSLEAGSLRRYDFIHKLALELGKLPIETARAISFAMAQNAEKFGSDLIAGESQRALAGTFVVAQRLSGSEEINKFISDCIGFASDDLFAARLYKFMTSDRGNNNVVVDFQYVDNSAIQDAFARRMDRLYGPAVDVAALDARAISAHAFWVWSAISEDERSKEISFWERYIGESRGRLAEAFEAIAPKGTFWANGSQQFVDQIIPSAMLGRLFTDLASGQPLEPRHEEALNRLGRFLGGELKEGEVL